MNGNFLERKNLRELQKILRVARGLEINDEDYLREAAVSCIKFHIAKILRQAQLSSKNNDDGG